MNSTHMRTRLQNSVSEKVAETKPELSRLDWMKMEIFNGRRLVEKPAFIPESLLFIDVLL